VFPAGDKFQEHRTRPPSVVALVGVEGPRDLLGYSTRSPKRQRGADIGPRVAFTHSDGARWCLGRALSFG